MKRAIPAVGIASVWLFLTALPPATGADEKAPPAAKAQPAAKADKVDRQTKSLARLVRDIRAAKDVNSAAADYAEARNITRNNPEVYEAYMTRMLQLGKPKIALYAALELIRLKPDNGLAWATLAYNRVRQGRNLSALTAAIHAMKHRSKDASVQHNTANLLAWYETIRPRPKLPAEAAKILDQSLRQWRKLDDFAYTYEKARGAFTGKARRLQELEAQIAEAQRRHDPLAREARNVDNARRRNQDDIQGLWRNVRTYRWRLRDIERLIANETDPAELRRLRRRRLDVRRDIGDALKDIQDRQEENESLDARAGEIKANLKKLTVEAGKLRAAIKELGPVQPAFTWHPPVVEGAVAPKGRPGPKPKPDDAPKKPSRHERLLKMAKLLLANNFEDKAAETLREIVTKHPNTNSAKEAAKILKDLEG